MNKHKILGVLIILSTWLVAGGIYFGIIPNFPRLHPVEGAIMTVLLTMLGIAWFFSKRKRVNHEEENDDGTEEE